jgi:hypothetical protein
MTLDGWASETMLLLVTFIIAGVSLDVGKRWLGS